MSADRFRVGRQVPRHVYDGDEPLFTARTAEEAAEFVALLNRGAGPGPDGTPPTNDRGRLAYATRWEGHTLGPRGAAPAWDDLGEEGRAVWRRIADKLRDDQTAQFIAESDAMEREEVLRRENRLLRIALHDAIRRPLGVTPDSAAEFYDQRMADEAEERRPRWSDRPRPAAPTAREEV